jgi:dihydrofolate reductase
MRLGSRSTTLDSSDVQRDISKTGGRSMRRIINSTFITIDGVIQHPENWPYEDVEDGSEEMQIELLRSCDAVLMGRHTYDGFAPAWSARSGDEYSDRINAMRKYVVSSSLAEADWQNTTVISGDPVPEISKLKEQPGKDIVQYGFGQLSFTLMEHGLLDELRLWVYPLFVGRGGRAAPKICYTANARRRSSD